MVIGLWIFPHEVPRRLQKIPLIGQFGLKHALAFGGGKNTTLGVLLMAVLGGLLAYYFGFHPAVGAYMGGLILKEEYFRFNATKTADDMAEQDHFATTSKIIDNVAFVWIGPVFFVVLGTHIVFDWEVLISVIPQIAILTIGIIVAQIASASLAARYTGGFNFQESMMIGFGMLGRAELCFVVMDIAVNFLLHASQGCQTKGRKVSKISNKSYLMNRIM